MFNGKIYWPCFEGAKSIVIATSVILVACNAMPKSEVKTVRGKTLGVLFSSTPLVAQAEETVTLSGENLIAGRGYTAIFKLSNGNRRVVAVTALNEGTAILKVPADIGLGQRDFDVTIGERTINSFKLVVDDESDNLSVYTGEASDICSTKTFISKSGEKTTGTKDCSLLSLPDCKADGELGCKAIPMFPAASLSNAVVSNIRSGVTIAGVTGSYPSSVYPLAGADVTADLSDNQETRDAQLRSATNFEFFKSDGTRVVAAGDADVDDATNIKDQVVLFGRSGSYTGAAAPNPWDLRRGVTVGGVTGKLYVNCRNRARTAVYNYDGAVTAITNSGVSTGTTLDYWDTIDDNNNNVSGMPTDVITGWSNNDCQGVESSPGDDMVWKDVTTIGDGTTASNCATTGAHCTMKDKITGLEWSKQANYSFANSSTTNASPTLLVSSTANLVPDMVVAGTGIPASTRILSINSATQITMTANATATASNVTVTVTTARWSGAVNYCDALNHNGANNWRLPTQKELLDAYNHGIRSAASVNWISEANMALLKQFWSASSLSTNTDFALGVGLGDGRSVGLTFKISQYQVVCVR